MHRSSFAWSTASTAPAQKLREGFRRVSESASKLKRNVGGAIATRFSIDNLEAATQKAEANLQKSRQRLIGAAAMGAIIVSPIMMAANFSSEMANVSTLIDTTVESMDAMKSTVLDIAGRTPVKLSDLTAALYQVRSAGISAADQFQGSGGVRATGRGRSRLHRGSGRSGYVVDQGIQPAGQRAGAHL